MFETKIVDCRLKFEDNVLKYFEYRGHHLALECMEEKGEGFHVRTWIVPETTELKLDRKQKVRHLKDNSLKVTFYPEGDGLDFTLNFTLNVFGRPTDGRSDGLIRFPVPTLSWTFSETDGNVKGKLRLLSYENLDSPPE